jgi:hypothetical protein
LTISLREGWAVLHGTLFGAALLLAFAGGLAGLYGLRPEWDAAPKIEKHILGLKIMVWGAALIAWGTVMTGAFIVYPWYEAAASTSAEITLSPYGRLLVNPVTADWNNFGMAWKQHVGWLAPIAATVVAFAVTYYGPQLAKRTDERRALMVFFVIGFAAAATAGVFGALLNKVAPIG